MAKRGLTDCSCRTFCYHNVDASSDIVERGCGFRNWGRIIYGGVYLVFFMDFYLSLTVFCKNAGAISNFRLVGTVESPTTCLLTRPGP